MKHVKQVICLFCCLAVFMAASCGYHFEGGGYLNETVVKVAVMVFENNSAEDDVELLFTNALVQEIVQKSDTVVVDTEQADSVLKGSVKAITFKTVSRSTAESVVERRITAKVDLQLIDKDGEIIWSVQDFITYDEYQVSDDQLEDESNKHTKIADIAERSAEKLVSKLLTNF